MREVERYQLDVVRLTSTYSLGSGTPGEGLYPILLWSYVLFYSGCRERQWAVVG